MSKPSTSGRRRVLQLLRPVLLSATFIFVLTLALAGLNAVEPLILKLLFDRLGVGGAPADLVRALVYLAALLAVKEVLQALTNRLTWRSRLKLQYSLLEGSVHRLHNLPMSYHQREGVGATMTRLDRGIQGFVSAFSDVAFQALPGLVYLIASIYFMLGLNVELALLVLAFTPVPIVISRIAAPVQARRERDLLSRWARIYSRFNEVLAGIVMVKSFTREEEEKQRFLDHVGGANREVERGVGFDSRVAAAHNLTIAVARIASLGLGGVLAIRGDITVGTLVAFLGYVGGLFGPLQGLASIYQTIRKASASLDVIASFQDAEVDVADHPKAIAVSSLTGDVRFEGLHFGYAGHDREILSGIDLHVQPGERVAVVGPSGAGKTTLMSLLLRFYEPTAGRVAVDGHDIRTLTQRSLRRNIGVVLQDALLFDDTIRNNIAYGRPDAPESAISEAARHANAHEMIMRLPHGYETSVGERGARLSAGERQRIAIARALLKDPSILILDEATSALDAETEHLVQGAIDHLTEGRTTFVIAHRLSTVLSAHRIVVLDRGRIEEEGTHASLVARGGTYARLVQRQIGGLLSTA